MSLIWLNINIDLRRPFQLYVLINVLNHWFHQLGRLIEWGRKLLDTRNGWWQCEMMNRSITSSSSTFPCLHGTEGNSRGTQLDALPVTNIFYSSEAVDGCHDGALALVNRLQELFNFFMWTWHFYIGHFWWTNRLQGCKCTNCGCPPTSAGKKHITNAIK